MCSVCVLSVAACGLYPVSAVCNGLCMCVCTHVHVCCVCGCMCVCIECLSSHSFVCTAANKPRQPSSIFVATSSSA